MVQDRVDPNRAHTRRAQHLCAVLQSRFAPVVLEMATHGWCGLECGEQLRTTGAASFVCLRLADRPGHHVSHQPFRSVWVASSLVVSYWAPLHAAGIPYSRPVPPCTSPLICRMAARVLVGASDDGCAL